MTISPGRRLLYVLGPPGAAVVFSLLASAVVLLLAGSNPLEAYGDMLQEASELETMVDILNRATPLYISGIAAAVGFRMNLFNIGVEGQYILAAFFAAVAGAAVSLPAPLHIAFILVVAMAVGAGWAGIAGALKVTRGVNEVVSTIMLNYIAIGGVVAWLSVRWRDGGAVTTSSGTPLIDDSGRLSDLNGWLEIFTRDISPPRELTAVLLIAIAVGVVYHVFVNRTRLGYDLRASGWNPFAAQAGGVPAKRMVMLAMLLSGTFAGLVGMVEILSNFHRYDPNFTPGLGFAGIAVALLGRNHPIGVAAAAILFSFLSESSGVLQFTGAASPEIVTIMQGMILLAAVISYEAFRRLREADEARTAAALLGGADQ